MYIENGILLLNQEKQVANQISVPLWRTCRSISFTCFSNRWVASSLSGQIASERRLLRSSGIREGCSCGFYELSQNVAYAAYNRSGDLRSIPSIESDLNYKPVRASQRI